MEKKGQMEISFGMIFTIILVAVFLTIAFFAISKFLNFQKTVQIEQFFDNFQNDLDKMYGSEQGTKQVTYNLPSNAREVCFVGGAIDRVRVELKKGSMQKQINHLNMEEILNSRDEVCAKVIDQKVTFVISMNYGESSVIVKF